MFTSGDTSLSLLIDYDLEAPRLLCFQHLIVSMDETVVSRLLTDLYLLPRSDDD